MIEKRANVIPMIHLLIIDTNPVKSQGNLFELVTMYLGAVMAKLLLMSLY